MFKRVYVTLLLFMFVSVANAEPLWQQSNTLSATRNSIVLPINALEAQAISLPAASLAQLAEGGDLSIRLPAGELEYQITRLQTFMSGENGVQAALKSAGEYVLSLTYDANDLVATVYTPTGKLRVIARRHGALYEGYMFRESDAFLILPTDDGPLLADNRARGSPTYLYLESEKSVRITQTFSSEVILVGNTVTATIDILNNTDAVIKGETLKVYFIFDRANFVDSTAGCSLKVIDYAEGPANELKCAIPDLAPGAKSTISYTVRTDSKSIPSLQSAASFGQASKADSISVVHDVLKDTDADGISDFNEQLLGTDPSNAVSGPKEGKTAEIDLLFVYTPKFVADSSTGKANLELNQLLQETNAMFANSEAGISFRAVGYRQVDHVVSKLKTTLNLMADQTAPFQDLEYQRVVAGADLVVFMDGFINEDDDACGLAYPLGLGLLGDFTSEEARNRYSANYAAGSKGKGEGCGSGTLAHELGHNLGLGHSRVEGKGTFPWSLGHGVKGSFLTIMSYDTHFPDSVLVPLFSNPRLVKCEGQPCGVDSANETSGADSVKSLNAVRFQVARSMQTRPTLRMANATGAATSAQTHGSVIRTNGSNPADNKFGTHYSNTDLLSLVGSITLDPADVGKVGRTHMVIAAAGLGFFQVNAQGNYVEWNGDPATLLGSITPRPLRAIEELTAFKNLSFADIGIPQVSLEVYFAYSIDGTNQLVYTSPGAPLVIR